MTLFWFIIGIVLAGMIVFLTAFFSIKYFLENDQKKKLLELKYESKSLVTPVRIQAYERLALLLERIDPNQLILRLNNLNLTAEQLKMLMITTIRAEYEHNLSQQIFVSSEVWAKIIQAKEETIKLINIASGNLPPDASSLDLATAILEKVIVKAPGAIAMESLKEEMRLLF